jgi:hypothetical protein
VAGETNAVTLDANSDFVLVTDTKSLITPGPGCLKQAPAHTVACSPSFTPGSDVIQAELGNGNDTRTVTPAMPLRVVAHGGDGDDVLRGGAHDDQLFGSAGNDTVDGAGGQDGMFGGDGTDTVDYSTRTSGVLVVQPGTVGDGETGELEEVGAGVENVLDGAGKDTLIDSDGPNVLAGHGGDDILRGRRGTDTLDGGPGFNQANYQDRSPATAASSRAPGRNVRPGAPRRSTPLGAHGLLAAWRSRHGAVASPATEPLLERDAELAAMDELLDAATHGHGGLTLVEGPPGVGKSARARSTNLSSGRSGVTKGVCGQQAFPPLPGRRMLGQINRRSIARDQPRAGAGWFRCDRALEGEVVMRRMLFPALGVVVLLLAYAGQELAAGAPSAPRDSAQTGSPVRLLADEAKVLKHIAVAEDMPLESLPADHKTHRLVKDMKRFDAWVEQKADEILADAHKAHVAQEVPTDPALAEALRLKAEALVNEGSKLTLQELREMEQLPSTSTETPSSTPTGVDTQEIDKLIAEMEASMLADLRALYDTFLAMDQTIQSNIWGALS